MNTVKVFAEGVAKQIHDYLPSEYGNVQCEIQENLKNNGVRLVGIVMQDIANSYIQHERSSRAIDERSLMDYEYVRQWIEPVLLNTADNREMLAQMPHRKMADLSLYYSVVFPNQGDDMRASMKIKNGHMAYWSVSEQDLYTQAISNIESRETNTLFPMDSVLAAMLTGRENGQNLLKATPGENMQSLPGGMYVLTNEQKTYGASLLAVPGIMGKVDQLFPEGYYILPSSIHETIILPKPCGVPAKELGEMVRDINRTQVNREERLSDCVYEYDKEKSVIRQVPESVRRREMER